MVIITTPLQATKRPDRPSKWLKTKTNDQAIISRQLATEQTNVLIKWLQQPASHLSTNNQPQ